MTDRDIRAMLRGATRDKVIFSWKVIGDATIAPLYYVNVWPNPPIPPKTRGEAVEYCRALAAQGVEPMYLDSEPLWNDFDYLMLSDEIRSLGKDPDQAP